MTVVVRECKTVALGESVEVMVRDDVTVMCFEVITDVF